MSHSIAEVEEIKLEDNGDQGPGHHGGDDSVRDSDGGAGAGASGPGGPGTQQEYVRNQPVKNPSSALKVNSITYPQLANVIKEIGDSLD